MEIITQFIQLFASFVVLFGICEFGFFVSNTFEEINIMLDQLKWYLFPYEIRRMQSIILIIAQEPVEFKILGSVSCNRKACKKVSAMNMIQF